MHRAGLATWLVCTFAAGGLLAAVPSPTVAVLAVDAARDGAPDARAAAAMVRSTLAGIAVQVVGTDETRARLNKMPRGPTLSTDLLRRRLMRILRT